MITFRRAPTVETGDLVTSTQFNGLARAIQDRQRSGVADPNYRIWQLAYNTFRLPRAPEGLQYPSEGEFFWYYMLLEKIGSHWPTVEPGEPEGGNVASTGMAYVLGTTAEWAEGFRLSGAFNIGLTDFEPALIWDYRKRQCGGYDPDTGNLGSPAQTAAESFYRIVSSPIAFHGKSYGGYQPAPEYLGDCGDEQLSSSWRLRWTPLFGGLPTYEFEGTCPYGSPGWTSSHVRYVADLPVAWYVVQWNGTVTRIQKDQYIEGPYEGGGRLFKPTGQQIPRFLLNSFLKDFRGTETQRSNETFDITSIAFSFQEFFTGQYLLAPNKAHMDGDELVDDYPTFDFSGASTLPAGTTTTSHQYADGFVLGGLLIQATKLVGSVTIELLDSGEAFALIQLTADENGNASLIRFWTDGRQPNLTFRLGTSATFTDASGRIDIETSEQVAQNPKLHDAYFVVRCSTAKEPGFDYDTSGDEYSGSLSAYLNYKRYGCVVNLNGALAVDDHSDAVTPNPAFDACRRLFKSRLRLVTRQQLIGYEVSGGKSILYFTRYALGDPNADSFRDIADAIEHTAPANGYTNEWMLFIQLKAFKDSEDSIWKPSAYGDFFPWSNRCHFYSPTVTTLSNSDLLHHFRPGGSDMDQYLPYLLAPEAPSGYNYAGTSNTPGRYSQMTEEDRIAFYRSCQIYQPDYEVEDCTSGTYLGYPNAVKVTLTSRLQHCDDAPESISPDPAGWSIQDLADEPYRTDENGIRQYLIYMQSQNAPESKIGDAAIDATVFGSGGPWATVLPHFFFTKLAEEVYEDGNDTQEDHDTLLTMDPFQAWEWYARAMGEGYVDRVTSIEYACNEEIPESVSPVVDYSWENLCYQAFGGRWMSVFPSAVRPDRPEAFGPLPNTLLYADAFNQLSGIFNLMTHARLMLPHQLLCRYRTYQDTEGETADWEYGNAAVFLNFTATQPTSLTEAWDDYSDCPYNPGTGKYGIAIASSVNVDGKSNGDYDITSVYNEADYKFELTDPNAIYALPGTIVDMANSASIGFVARKYACNALWDARQVASSGESEGCPSGSGHWWDGAIGYKFDELSSCLIVTLEECGLYNNGTLVGEMPPASDLGYGYSGEPCRFGAYRGVLLEPRGDQPVAVLNINLEDQ